jgi:hypothetical protein
VEGAQLFRQHAGLRSDRDYVTRSFQDAELFPDRSMAYPLSLDEASDIHRRIDVQLAVDPAAGYAQGLPDSAGVYMDQLDGGAPVFLTSGDVGQFTSAIATRVPEGVYFRVEHVAFSRASLEQAKASLAESMQKHRDNGMDVRSVGIDVAHNRLLVGIAGLGENDGSYLSGEYGVPVTAAEESTHQLDACIDRVTCPPLKGGIKMYETNHTSSICTTGFIVKLAGTSTLRMLTAGHCIELGFDGIGGGWSHHGTQFGTAKTETWGLHSDADAGLVSLTLTTGKNLFFASAAYDIRSLISYIPNSQQNVGDFICRSAKVTGYLCGEIETENVAKDVDGKSIDHQWVVDFDASPGDSGASMFVNQAAYGIHTDSTSADPPGGHGWYSPIGWVLTKLSNYGVPIELCVTSTCT